MTSTPAPYPFSQFVNLDDPIVQMLAGAIWGLLLLLAALLIARFGRRWVVRILTRGKMSINLATLLGNLVQIGLVIVGIIAMLSALGVDPTGLLALLGAAGLAVSLSMQDILKNVFAGIYILLEQPFRIGDRITVKDVTGKVQGIELRTTLLWTDDNLQIVVPNNMIFTEILTNRSASDLQRQTIILDIRGGNLSEISQEIDNILKTFEQIAAKPAPITALEEIKDGSIQLRVEFWTRSNDRLAVTAQVVEALQARFSNASATVVP